MTTSQNAFLSEVDSEFAVIPAEKRAFLQERLRTRLYDLILTEFMEHQSRNPAFTKAALARRIGSRPEVINRILSSPGNWTIDTISNLLAGISGSELGLASNRFAEYHIANHTRPEWLVASNPSTKPSTQPISAAEVVTGPTSNIGNPISRMVGIAFVVTSTPVEALR
jgi:hypothetical protein